VHTTRSQETVFFFASAFLCGGCGWWWESVLEAASVWKQQVSGPLVGLHCDLRRSGSAVGSGRIFFPQTSDTAPRFCHGVRACGENGHAR
jgi:hypothetical protein